jgi:hypothetical protein
MEGIQEKYPKLGGYLVYLSEVWDETFPSVEKQMAKRRAMRKKQAREQREYEEKLAKMTPEELEQWEQSIPEWKRGALVVNE